MTGSYLRHMARESQRQVIVDGREDRRPPVVGIGSVFPRSVVPSGERGRGAILAGDTLGASHGGFFGGSPAKAPVPRSASIRSTPISSSPAHVKIATPSPAETATENTAAPPGADTTLSSRPLAQVGTRPSRQAVNAFASFPANPVASAEPEWSEGDAWWAETLSRVIHFQASADEPDGGIGGTGREPDPDGGIGGTGRDIVLGSRSARADTSVVETGESPVLVVPEILPTFLDIYDRDLDEHLSPVEMAWMETQPHGLPHLHMLTFDLDLDESISPVEAWIAQDDLHEHVLLVRQTHFNGADVSRDGRLDFHEFLELPAVVDLYHSDAMALVSAYVSLHDDDGQVTFDSFHRAVKRSERAVQPTEP